MRSRSTLPALAAFLVLGSSALAGSCPCAGGGGTYTTSGPSQAVATQGYFVNGTTSPAPAMAPMAATVPTSYAPAQVMSTPTYSPGYMAARAYPTYTRGYGRLFRRR